MFYEIVRGRRSVRVYDGRVVPRDVLTRILEAARWAPSAHNAQPWRFIVIYEDDVKRRTC
jgi:nitroreductase